MIELTIPSARHSDVLQRMASLFRRMRTVSRSDRARSLESDTLRALERLAEGSPHLLADAGFQENHAAKNPMRSVWQRDALIVEIWSDGRIVATSEPR